MQTLFKFETALNADSVEWCPHDPFKTFFVCANYSLINEETQERVGKILLFSIDPDNGLKLHQTLNTGAVFDQKWCFNRVNNQILLGVVNADSKLEIYRLKDSFELELVTQHQVAADGSNMLLSLDWSNGKFESQCPSIVCSDSGGNWHKFSLSNGRLSLEMGARAHEFEAWIAAFYYWDPNVIFTGGDDAQLKKFDTRIGVDCVAKNKNYCAGVTSLHSNANKEFIIACGSYNEHLQVCDVRSLKSPIIEKKMPGPIWRVKWDPFDFKYMLVACMLEGAHVVEMKEEELQLVSSYNEHKSITYGSDWCFLNQNQVSAYCSNSTRIVGTCSFYDHLLCVSKLRL